MPIVGCRPVTEWMEGEDLDFSRTVAPLGDLEAERQAHTERIEKYLHASSCKRGRGRS